MEAVSTLGSGGNNHFIERSSRQCLRVSTTHPHTYLMLSVFCILVILVGVQWYVIVDFTLYFSKVSNIHMLIGHWLSSFVKNLSFVHCLNGLFVFSLYIGKNSFFSIIFFNCSLLSTLLCIIYRCLAQQIGDIHIGYKVLPLVIQVPSWHHIQLLHCC